MNIVKKAVVFAMLCSNVAFASPTDPEVVKNIDLKKYMGDWYEIAHNPNYFQNFCDRSTAQYSLNQEGAVNVLNTCYKDEKVVTTIQGVASAPNANEPTKLVVDFGFSRKGDYWIVGLDENYQWAIVSGPKKDSLFILARTAPMNPATLNQILEDLKNRGFDISKIIFDKY